MEQCEWCMFLSPIPFIHMQKRYIVCVHLVEQTWALVWKGGHAQYAILVGLARTVYIYIYIRRIWPYIVYYPCQKYRIFTVYIWFWPTLDIGALQCRSKSPSLQSIGLSTTTNAFPAYWTRRGKITSTEKPTNQSTRIVTAMTAINSETVFVRPPYWGTAPKRQSNDFLFGLYIRVMQSSFVGALQMGFFVGALQLDGVLRDCHYFWYSSILALQMDGVLRDRYYFWYSSIIALQMDGVLSDCHYFWYSSIIALQMDGVLRDRYYFWYSSIIALQMDGVLRDRHYFWYSSIVLELQWRKAGTTICKVSCFYLTLARKGTRAQQPARGAKAWPTNGMT